MIERSGVDPARVDDVVFSQGYGNAEAPAIGHWSWLAAGLPLEVPGYQLDRRCGSGLQAVANAAMMVETGMADVVVAGESAVIDFPESRRGLSAGFTAPLLSFRLGSGGSPRLLMTGETLVSTKAMRLGLFHEVVSDDFVWARANEIASDCAQGARETHQMTKQMINETIGEQMLTQLSIAAANTAAARTTDAAQEGIAAFLEKRDPRWDDLK